MARAKSDSLPELETYWELFKKQAVPEIADPNQVYCMRVAFISGLWSALEFEYQQRSRGSVARARKLLDHLRRESARALAEMEPPEEGKTN